SAFMELAGLEDLDQNANTIPKDAGPGFERVHARLVESPDIAADVRDPVWRGGYIQILAYRGMFAVTQGDRDGGIALLAVAESLAPPEMGAMVQQMLAYAE